MLIDQSEAEKIYETSTPGGFIDYITDKYLESLDGSLTADNMQMLSDYQHTLLAYRYLKDEVMEGGLIQLIYNGYAPYVLESAFPYIVKKEWKRKEFGKYLFEAKRLYHKYWEDIETDLTDEEFMALYEKFDDLNDLGDDFLEEHQEKETPWIARYVYQNIELFI